MEYLKVSEFAKVVGVTSVTIRDWEKRGWLIPHHKSPSGYRYYTREQADEFINSGRKRHKSDSKD